MNGSSVIDIVNINKTLMRATAQLSNDSNLFIISLVPINLSCNEEQVWQNPSTRYCRPIKFEYAKETEYVKQENQKTQEQIKDLQETVATIKGQQFSIEHKLEQTMVDGKVCNALTDNKSTSSCYICKTK